MAFFNQSRSKIIRLIIGSVFLLIIIQLFNLQILSGKYRELALNNAIFARVKYPDRGIIFDRKGRAILNNTILYDLVVTPSEVKKIDTAALCRLLEISEPEFRKRLLEARPDLATRLFQTFERAKTEAYRRDPAARAIFTDYDLAMQRQAFGDDPYPYGLQANRQVLELVAGQLEIDGLIRKRPDIDSLVAEPVRGS